MTIKIEQVDLIMQRANVGYAEAKEALDKCGGSMVDALVYLEKRNKVRQRKTRGSEGSVMDKAANLISKGNRTKFIIRKKEKDILNIPVNLAIIAGIFAAPVAAAGILLALLTSHRIRIEKEDGAGIQANDIMDKVSHAVETAKESFAQKGDTGSGDNTQAPAPADRPAAE